MGSDLPDRKLLTMTTADHVRASAPTGCEPPCGARRMGVIARDLTSPCAGNLLWHG